jgi:hypothetical protein
MFEGSKSMMNLMIGFSLFILGTLGVFDRLKILPFDIPDLPKIILYIFMGCCGFYLMLDGIMMLTLNPLLMMIDIGLGLLIASVGLFPLLSNFGILNIVIPIPKLILDICLVIAGGLLIFNSWNF